MSLKETQNFIMCTVEAIDPKFKAIVHDLQGNL